MLFFFWNMGSFQPVVAQQWRVSVSCGTKEPEGMPSGRIQTTAAHLLFQMFQSCLPIFRRVTPSPLITRPSPQPSPLRGVVAVCRWASHSAGVFWRFWQSQVQAQADLFLWCPGVPIRYIKCIPIASAVFMRLATVATALSSTVPFESRT